MCDEIAQAASYLFSSDGGKANVVLVDVGQTRSTFWPIVRGLASASPEYMKDLAEYPPRILARIYNWYFSIRFSGPPTISTWYFDNPKASSTIQVTWKDWLIIMQDLILNLFVRPVNRIHRKLARRIQKTTRHPDHMDQDLETGPTV